MLTSWSSSAKTADRSWWKCWICMERVAQLLRNLKKLKLRNCSINSNVYARQVYFYARSSVGVTKHFLSSSYFLIGLIFFGRFLLKSSKRVTSIFTSSWVLFKTLLVPEQCFSTNAIFFCSNLSEGNLIVICMITSIFLMFPN